MIHLSPWLVCLVYNIPTDLYFTSVTCFFYFVFFSPLDLRTSEWTARGYVTNSWGYGVILIPVIEFFTSSPYFRGEMWKLLQILPKMWWCRYLASCLYRTAQHMKTGKYSFERRIIMLHFGEKYAKFPFTHFWGTVADALGVPIGLLLPMKYHAIAAF